MRSEHRERRERQVPRAMLWVINIFTEIFFTFTIKVINDMGPETSTQNVVMCLVCRFRNVRVEIFRCRISSWWWWWWLCLVQGEPGKHGSDGEPGVLGEKVRHDYVYVHTWFNNFNIMTWYTVVYLLLVFIIVNLSQL